jgi:hypothetical protein
VLSRDAGSFPALIFWLEDAQDGAVITQDRSVIIDKTCDRALEVFVPKREEASKGILQYELFMCILRFPSGYILLRHTGMPGYRPRAGRVE